MREFATGATRDDDKTKLDYEGFLSPLVLRRYAEYMHKNRVQADGKLRAADNWQKGIPPEAYMKSLWRHFMDTWMIWRTASPKGEIWENVLCAVLFNVMGLLHESLVSQTPERCEVSDSGKVRDKIYMGGGSSVVDKSFGPQEIFGLKPSFSDSLSGRRLDIIPRGGF